MRNTKLVILLVAVLTLSTGLVAMAGENDEPEMALVDFTEVVNEVVEEDGEIEMLSQTEVGEIAKEMGYDFVVDKNTLEFYLDGVIDSITCMNLEGVTEEVNEVIQDKEELEEIKAMDEVEVITEEIIEELEN